MRLSLSLNFALLASVWLSGCADDLMPLDAGSPDATPAPIDAPWSDSDPGDARPPDTDAAPPEVNIGPTYYPTDRTLSPISPRGLERLGEIVEHADDLRDDVFAKVGASATVSSSFLHCFGGDLSQIDLAGRDALQPTIDVFRAADAAGESPFTRTSLSATVGWAAARVIRGEPSPLDQELDAIRPRLAVLMYGTNDVGYRNLPWYADSMLTLVDRLIDRGVIPLLTTIMPRDDGEWAPEVRVHNAVVRGIAQAREVPLIDYHRLLEPLEDHGLSGDGVHPNTYRNGGRRACAFHEEGLQFGYNIRNLITIQTLHRVRESMTTGIELEAADPAISGDGSVTDPITINRFPFRDIRSTLFSDSRRLDEYSGCDANQDESGPEVLYRLELDRMRHLTFYVFDRGEVDIDLHLLDETGSEAGCLQRAHESFEATLPPGTFYLSLDTFVSASGVESAGEYLLLVLDDD